MFRKKSAIYKKLSYAFSTISLLALAVGYLGISGILKVNRLNVYIERVDHTRDQLTGLQNIILEQTNEGLHFMLLGSSSAVPAFNELGERFRNQFEAVKRSFPRIVTVELEQDFKSTHTEFESVITGLVRRYAGGERLTETEIKGVHERFHALFYRLRKDCMGIEALFETLHEKEYREIKDVTTLTITRMIWVGLSVFILVALLGMWASERFSRPLVQLRNAAVKIGDGDLRTKIAIHTNDEIEDLASEFTRMAKKLECSYNVLEARVEKRTRELVTEQSRMTMLLFGISAAGTLVIVIDEGYGIESLNTTASRILGNVVGEKCYKVFYKSDVPCSHCRLKGVVEGGETVRYEALEYAGRMYSVWAAPMKDSAGRMSCVEVLHDITENRNTEKALRSTNELLERIFSSTHIMIAYMDSDFNFIRVNRAYAEADGRDPGFFTGRNHFDIYPDEEIQSIFRRVVESGEPYSVYGKPFEWPEHPEQGIRYRDWDLNPVRGDEGVVEGLVCCMLDVTRRKEAEKDLQALYKELENKNIEMRNLSKRLIYLQEQARKELSRELHDQLGQILTIIKMDVELGAGAVPPVCAGLQDKMQRVGNALTNAIRAVKTICNRLRPNTLDNMGLIPSLSVLIEELEEHGGLQIKLYVDDDFPPRFAPDIEIAVYRIVQEALTNIIKYAQARHVFINLVKRRNLISLGVEDDGVGFDTAVTLKKPGFMSKGLGLLIMKERARQLQGDFSIESSPGHGTHVLVEIPVDAGPVTV